MRSSIVWLRRLVFEYGSSPPISIDLCADDEDPSQLIIRPGWDAPHVRCSPRMFCAWPCLLRQVGTVLGSPYDYVVARLAYANPGSRKQSLHPRVQAPLFYPWWQQHIPKSHVSVTQARHQGAEPTIKHNAPSWSCKQNTWPKQNTATENMQEFTQEQNIKEKNQIYYSSQSEHSLIIHHLPANSA